MFVVVLSHDRVSACKRHDNYSIASIEPRLSSDSRTEIEN